MVKMLDVRIPTDGAIQLGARLLVPEGPRARPCISMAHGFAGIKKHGIKRCAEASAAASFVVLVHDHRNFGTSGGEPLIGLAPAQAGGTWFREHFGDRPHG